MFKLLVCFISFYTQMHSKIGFWLRRLGLIFWVFIRALPLAMVAHSRHQNLSRLLAKFPTFECICVYLFVVYPSNLYSFDFEKEIADPRHPSREEYQSIQNYLASIFEETTFPPTVTSRCKVYFQTIKLFGKELFEEPIFEIVHCNNNPNDKRNCIVMYVSYNPPYPDNVLKILAAVQEIGFEGHIIYRIGGYPNLENNSLKLIEVPYAFKACALQEASLLGYQNILWLDCSLTPTRDLRSLFDRIENEGYFGMTSGSNMQAELDKGYINLHALSAMGIPDEQLVNALHITTPIFGVNVDSDVGKALLRRFYDMAENQRAAFFCELPDEASISAIFHQMQLAPSGNWEQFMVKEGEWDGISDTHYFIMNLKRPEGRN